MRRCALYPRQTLNGIGEELSRVRVDQNLRQALNACMREQGLA